MFQLETSGDPPLSPESAAEAAERRRMLLDAMRQLRVEDNLVLAYRYFFDLSEAEMAEALGCARGTVKSRLSRALGRLRQTLAPKSGGLAVGGLSGGTDG